MSSSRMAILLTSLLLIACDREKRFAEVPAGAAARVKELPQSTLQPGGGPGMAESVANPYEGNYDAANQGKKLFSSFNCSGCHSPGGGGAIGPPLIDDYWIYGGDPARVFETIVKGRPNGMPAFGAKLPAYQVWQLVTYVRGMNRPPLNDPKPPHL
jgi:cytochrome c oxidase cbb3-type subunit III